MNADALKVTLGELERLGRLERIDAAHVQALRSMAETLDLDPANASLWRQYREALSDLLEADRDADSALTAALAKIRGGAAVGDSSSA